MFESIAKGTYSVGKLLGKSDRLQIFIYHRVLDEYDPLMPSEPFVRKFDQQINVITKMYSVLPLQEASERLHNGTLDGPSACITFDDGYLDNYTNALPVLRKYQIPATVFVATDYLHKGIMWNDIVRESVRGFEGVFNNDRLGIHGYHCQSNLDKKLLVEKINSKIKYLDPIQREIVVEEIKQELSYKNDRLMLSVDELVKLSRSGIDIGAHTKSHPILTSLTESEAKAEVEGSKKELEEILGEEILTFAYPNGKFKTDYDKTHVNIVQQAGFKVSVTTEQWIASPKSNIYEMPRYTPWDSNMYKFILKSFMKPSEK